MAPTARDDDAVPQANRSSTGEVRDQLAAKIDQILARIGSAKVALVASSRGANAVRSYLKSGGAAKAGWAMLGGGVNHGVYATPGGPNSEFNGAAAFMRQLNERGLRSCPACGTSPSAATGWTSSRSPS